MRKDSSITILEVLEPMLWQVQPFAVDLEISMVFYFLIHPFLQELTFHQLFEDPLDQPSISKPKEIFPATVIWENRTLWNTVLTGLFLEVTKYLDHLVV